MYIDFLCLLFSWECTRVPWGSRLEGGSDTSLAAGPHERWGGQQAAGLPQPLVLSCHAFLGARPEFGLCHHTHTHAFLKPQMWQFSLSVFWWECRNSYLWGKWRWRLFTWNDATVNRESVKAACSKNDVMTRLILLTCCFLLLDWGQKAESQGQKTYCLWFTGEEMWHIQWSIDVWWFSYMSTSS